MILFWFEMIKISSLLLTMLQTYTFHNMHGKFRELKLDNNAPIESFIDKLEQAFEINPRQHIFLYYQGKKLDHSLSLKENEVKRTMSIVSFIHPTYQLNDLNKKDEPS